MKKTEKFKVKNTKEKAEELLKKKDVKALEIATFYEFAYTAKGAVKIGATHYITIHEEYKNNLKKL